MTYTPSLIRSVVVSGSGPDWILQFAFPLSATAPGTTTVLCGANGSGKTMLLEQIAQGLGVEGESQAARCPHLKSMETTTGSVGTTAQTFERCYFIRELPKKKNRIGRVELAKKIESPDDRFLFTFLHACFTYALEPSPMCGLEEWLATADRSRFVKGLGSNTVLYRLHRCPSSHPLVRDVESLLGGGLFFHYDPRKRSHIELVLMFSGEQVLRFSEWSDGQQAALYLLLFIHGRQPNVLLIDELENHLHPTLMTSLLGSLRHTVRQAIITTHHPHVIFSRHVDKVIFLEHATPPTDLTTLPSRTFESATRHQLTPWSGGTVPYKQLSRSITARELPDAFEKMAHIYKLFDLQDSELLQQAHFIRREAEVQFYRSLLSACTPDVVPPRGGLLPDRQTELLAKWMSLGNVGAPSPRAAPLRVLDIGSGLGRVVADLAKLSAWQLGSEIQWTCIEPEPNLRERLMGDLARRGISAEVFSNTHDLSERTFDFILVCNVVHELDLQSLSLLLSETRRLMTATPAKLLIAELYPLLHPEKFAVAYPEDSMRRLLQQCGYVSTSTSFSVRQSVAYCVRAALHHSTAMPLEQVKRVVDDEWTRLLDSSLNSYAALEGMSRFEHYARAIQDLTSIASIHAARAGIWGKGP